MGKFILGILLVLILIVIVIYFGFLTYPKIKENPKVGKWYRLSSSKMKGSEGGEYHALFKKGTENKVFVYFAGGGVSVNEQTARNDTYNTKLVRPDLLTNLTMNMGGVAFVKEKNPFVNWTVVMFPYATGDFHCGTGEYKYVDKDGKEKILYHNGYINFVTAMDMVMEKAGLTDTDTVVVTGYSAGGWAASILAEDVFEKYFPQARKKVVLVDSSVALYDKWAEVTKDVWEAPVHICDRVVSNNLTLDCLKALYKDYGDEVDILFCCSTRDGDLAKVSRYFRDEVLDESNGEMPLEEADGDDFQRFLKEFVFQLKEETGASIYLWDGLQWYDDPRNFTMHTIVETPHVFEDLESTGKSIASWLIDTLDEKKEDYGMDLLDKKHERTQG